MKCSRPEFNPSDGININCTPGSRDNYALLPYGVAPMAPSGPIEWSVKSVTSLLDLVAESCRKSYDPLTCIQGTPGFWVDLAQKFRSAGLSNMVDTGYDRINNCFFTTGAVYTIPPIDPNSIKDFDPSTYPWGQFFDLTYYFRTAPANVQPSPRPEHNWGVYNLAEYPNDTCSGDPVSECTYAAMSMAQASTFGNSCQAYSSIGSKECTWKKNAKAASFKIKSTIVEGLEESAARNQASTLTAACGYYVYEEVYSSVCGGSKVCDCQFVVLDKKKSSMCEDVQLIPFACSGANKVKYVEKAGPFMTQALAEAKKTELEEHCGSDSSIVIWYVYRRNHYGDADCAGEPDDSICDFIVSTDPYLESSGCYNGISYTKAGDPSGYLDEEIANTIRDLEEDDCRGSSSSGALPWHVYSKEEFDNDNCSGDPKDPCLFVVSTEVYTIGTCLIDEEDPGKSLRYTYLQSFRTEYEAQSYADIQRALCVQDSSSSTGAKYYVWAIANETIEGTCSAGVNCTDSSWTWQLAVTDVNAHGTETSGCIPIQGPEAGDWYTCYEFEGVYTTCTEACAGALRLYDALNREGATVSWNVGSVCDCILPD